MATKSKLVPIVVTTEHRGVFFGYGTPSAARELRIEQARMAVYWSADVRGVLGLASTGPTQSCKIGPAVPAITLQGVTSVIECSAQATAAWESGPWR